VRIVLVEDRRTLAANPSGKQLLQYENEERTVCGVWQISLAQLAYEKALLPGAAATTSHYARISLTCELEVKSLQSGSNSAS
jgi:hypothetical protein